MTARGQAAEASDAADEHPRAELRVWLRLFAATTLIENEIRSRLREQFDFTLPRFDMLAQLERAPEGIVLGDLSRRLMVTAGNVTAVCEKLIADGFISRAPSPADRRIQIVRMTRAGRTAFARVAEAHARWVEEFFDDLAPHELKDLNGLLSTLKRSVEARDIGRARVKAPSSAATEAEASRRKNGEAPAPDGSSGRHDMPASRRTGARARPAARA